MIPIISIASLVSAIISLGATLRVFLIYRQRKNDALWYFGVWFAVITVMFSFFASEGVITSGAVSAFMDAIGTSFVYVSCVLLIQIPFIFLNKREWGVISGIVIATAGLVFLIGLLLDPVPSVQLVLGPYLFWETQYPQWLSTYTGIVAGITTLTFTLTFLYLGYRGKRDFIILRRSAYLAGGMLSLMLAAISLLALPQGVFVAGMVFGSLAMVTGVILLYYGLLWMPSTISHVDIGESDNDIL
ncbi:MAG: hypothetical protein WC817_03220 [Patescibacteria group bacterium]|jgi:hypothetical protein